MLTRVAVLISQLGLRAHPEGGWYAETFRSPHLVQPADRRGDRAALTAIWFLLVNGTYSAWHRVESDESWHWYEGEALELFVAPPEGGATTRILLGPLATGGTPQYVVPAGWWQAARPTGSYSLSGCTVGPGFDFADFTLLRDVPAYQRPALDPALL
jgi:predicted cupin superfamily sugar epimerase